VLGKQIKLYVEDDQSKPEEAATVVTKLINQQHVVAVIGQVASSHSLAAAPICQASQIPMISPSSTNPRVTQVGDYIFRRLLHGHLPGRRDGALRVRHAEGQKVAILVDVRSDYSVGLQTFFGQAFKKLGGTIVSEQSFSQGDSDFRAQLTAIKAAAPDAVYVPGYYTEAGTIVYQARELGITVPFSAATAGIRPSSGRSAVRR
jgi:branched-chain amino acid transport system substrate-binding protein